MPGCDNRVWQIPSVNTATLCDSALSSGAPQPLTRTCVRTRERDWHWMLLPRVQAPARPSTRASILAIRGNPLSYHRTLARVCADNCAIVRPVPPLSFVASRAFRQSPMLHVRVHCGLAHLHPASGLGVHLRGSTFLSGAQRSQSRFPLGFPAHGARVCELLQTSSKGRVAYAAFYRPSRRAQFACDLAL